MASIYFDIEIEQPESTFSVIIDSKPHFEVEVETIKELPA